METLESKIIEVVSLWNAISINEAVIQVQINYPLRPSIEIKSLILDLIVREKIGRSAIDGRLYIPER